MLASGNPFLQIALRKYQQASKMPDFSRTPTEYKNIYFQLVPTAFPVIFQPLLRPSFISLYLYPYPSFHLFSYPLFCCSSNNFIMKLDYICLQVSWIDQKMEQIRKPKKYKWRAFAFLFIIQVLFFASVAITTYALITMNLKLIGILSVIVILQIPLKKIQPLVDIIVKYNHPSAYFDSFQVTQDSQIPPTQRCIFAYHPHSIYGMGVLGSNNFPGKAHFSNMLVLSSDFALNTPILGALLKIWGVSSASNSNVKKLMKEGKNIGVLPGGFEQATITSQNQMRLWISQRKGFIKYALQNNYKICPTIVLGEHKGFWTLQALESIRLLFNKIKIPGVFFWNRYSGIFLPTNMNIKVITGKLISRKVQDQAQLTKEEINQIHSEYAEQIQRLYNKYRDENGNCPMKFY